MADMVDCGRETFKAWARQTPSPAYAECWHNRWLGPFIPTMPAEQAWQLISEDKMTTSAGEAFKRGWIAAQLEYAATHPKQHNDGGADE